MMREALAKQAERVSVEEQQRLATLEADRQSAVAQAAARAAELQQRVEENARLHREKQQLLDAKQRSLRSHWVAILVV